MPDISMCSGKGCPYKDSCYRRTATPSYYQSYFSVPPIEDGECKYYWEVINKYKCNHCGKIFDRASSKKWIKSYCSETDKNCRLILIQ